MTMQRRKKISGTSAAEAAAAIIPDPSAHEAPPVEEHEADVDAAPEVSPRVDTGDAQALMEAGPWGTIIDTVLSVDPGPTFERLRDELRLADAGDVLTHQVVAVALEAADANYFDSVLLGRAAKLEEQRAEREIQERMEVLRTSARTSLETEKRQAAEKSGAKTTGKATLEEVRDRCIANWPDEMSSLERKRDTYAAARAACEELGTAWRSRASSLRELLGGLRSAP